MPFEERANPLELRFNVRLQQRGVGKPLGRSCDTSIHLEQNTMAMDDLDGKIWKDGKLVDWRDAKIHVLTHSLHYGMAVFEGVRAYQTEQGSAVFRLQEHTKRLFNSAKIFQMQVPFDIQTIVEAQLEVLRVNKLESAYVRPLIWIGSEKMGISAKSNTVHVAIAAWSWGAYLGEDGINKGIRVKTSSFSRHHVNVSMVRAKASGYYINSILANQEALTDGYDEALLLDTDGYVSEGSGENVFIVKNGKLYTPDLASCLDGITRDAVITMARDLGFEVFEKRITRDEMYCCDEAFFTGTAAEITPIRELDNRAIGDGKRGPITEQIQALFFEVVKGKQDKYRHWLTPY
jgi:branched-chain amino acid aminotransferase